MVDEPRRMDGRQSLGGLGQQLHLLGRPGRPRLPDILEAHPIDEFHHEVMLALRGIAILERADEMRMHELNSDLALGRTGLFDEGAEAARFFSGSWILRQTVRAVSLSMAR